MMNRTKVPLAQPWERAAAKEITDIQYYLMHGMFQGHEDLIERLHSAADRIGETVAHFSAMQTVIELVQPVEQTEPQLPALPTRASANWEDEF